MAGTVHASKAPQENIFDVKKVKFIESRNKEIHKNSPNLQPESGRKYLIAEAMNTSDNENIFGLLMATKCIH